MKIIIGLYDFELDNSGVIHVFETINNRRRYFDMIKQNTQILEDEFRRKCKEWYLENILIL